MMMKLVMVILMCGGVHAVRWGSPLGEISSSESVLPYEPSLKSGFNPGACAAAPSPLPESLPAESLTALKAALDPVFDIIMPRSTVNATGAVVQVTYKDQVVYTYTFGSTGQNGDPVTADTIFGIGSVSKLFPTFMLMHLRDAGLVSLDTQATAVNPNYRPKPYPGVNTKRGASLADLGSHMSGLARYSPCQFGDCPIDLATALDRIANWTLMYPPGSAVSYSNTGFSVLGRMLEGPAKATFEDYLTANLLKPLGMSSTSFAPPLSNPNLARAYNGDVAVPPPSLGFAVPAGGVYASANDMSKMLSMILRQDAAAGSRPDQVLDGTTLREWTTREVWQNPTQVKDNYVIFEAWGLPWEYSKVVNTNTSALGFGRYLLATKDGSVPGYHTQTVLSPQLNMGMFASMTEATNNNGGQFYTGMVVEAAFKVVPLLLEQLIAHPAPPKEPSGPLSDYVGKYTYETFAVVVELAPDGTSLIINLPVIVPPNTPLAYLGDDVFKMMAPGDACFTRQDGNDDYPVTFSRGSNGNVVSLLIDGLAWVPLVKSS